MVRLLGSLALLLLFACDQVLCPVGTEDIGGRCSPVRDAAAAQSGELATDAGGADSGGDESARRPGVSGNGGSGGAGAPAEVPQAGMAAPAGQGAPLPAAGTAAEPVDACVIAACDPRATCSVAGNRATCTCKAPFIGDGKACRRQTCADVQCDAHASCVAVGELPVCECNPGYTGDGTRCADVDECATQRPCAADATCNNAPGTYSCTCNSGFDGDGVTCTAHDYCRPNPCMNGRCSSLSDRASCDCAGTDYSGSMCEKRIDDCAPNPCLNGGTCSDALRSYVCKCARGFTGARCEQDVCAGSNCTSPFVCIPVGPGDPGAGGAVSLCSASCYPNCAAGHVCTRHEDCASRTCDVANGAVCK